MLIYDGECGFCKRSARWIEQRLPAGTPVVPWQSLDLDAVGLTRAQVESAAWWLDRRGGPHGGHLAIGRALVAARGGWPVVGALILVPPFRWLAAPAYRWVANNRHRMPGATDACAAEDQTVSPTLRSVSPGSSTSPVTKGPNSA